MFLDGELNTHSNADKSRGKGPLAMADINASTSFASLAASSINTGPYSDALKVPPPKSLYKPRTEYTNGFDGSDSLLADLDFRYLDERLLNKPPPSMNDDTVATYGSANVVDNLSDVDSLMHMVEGHGDGESIEVNDGILENKSGEDGGT